MSDPFSPTEVQPSTLTVICPKHGEHEHIIESTITGHEGVWCLLCWFESMGPSLPYRVIRLQPQDQPQDQPAQHQE